MPGVDWKRAPQARNSNIQTFKGNRNLATSKHHLPPSHTTPSGDDKLPGAIVATLSDFDQTTVCLSLIDLYYCRTLSLRLGALFLYQQPYLHHLSHRLLFLSTHLHTITIMAAAFTSVPAHGDAKPSSPVDLSTIPISPNGTNGHDENKNPNGESSTDEEQITVFHDKDNFNVKHPLMHKWTLWFTKPPSGKASLRRVTPTSNMLTFLSRVTTGTIY